MKQFTHSKSGSFNYFSHHTNSLLTKELITFILRGFFDTIMVNLDIDQYIVMVFKVQFEDGYKTINRAIRINKEDFKKSKLYYQGGLDLISENYKISKVLQITISYILPPKTAKAEDVKKSKLNVDRKQIKTPSYKFHGVNLPNTMDFLKWGSVIFPFPSHYHKGRVSFSSSWGERGEEKPF